MATTSVTINMDENLKNQAVVRQHKIPFEIAADIPNWETIKAIENARNGIGLSRPFNSVEELLEDLNADD